MLLTKEHQEALLNIYFPNGFTVTEGSTYLDGIKKGIELHQKYIENGK
jgi:hypothetical protein